MINLTSLHTVFTATPHQLCPRLNPLVDVQCIRFEQCPQEGCPGHEECCPTYCGTACRGIHCSLYFKKFILDTQHVLDTWVYMYEGCPESFKTVSVSQNCLYASQQKTYR